MTSDEPIVDTHVLDAPRYAAREFRSHEQFDHLAEIAGRWPGVLLTLSHACLPLERTPEEPAPRTRTGPSTASGRG